VIVNPNAPNHSYLMPPSYTTNCAIYVQTNPVISASITLATPTACSNLSFLGASFGGPVTNRFFIHHADGNTEQRTLVFGDWNTNGTAVYTNNGAINLTTRFVTNVNAGFPRLFAVDATVNNTTPITNIDISFIHGVGTPGNTARTVFFAVSGARLDGGGGGGGLTPFHITSQQQLSSSQFKLTWDSLAGTNYVILSKDSLANAAWITNGSVTAVGSSSTYTDTTILGVPRRFYKIEAPQH
jgi:hypothetical protein